MGKGRAPIPFERHRLSRLETMDPLKSDAPEWSFYGVSITEYKQLMWEIDPDFNSRLLDTLWEGSVNKKPMTYKEFESTRPDYYTSELTKEDWFRSKHKAFWDSFKKK